jgi:hypothetical protein
MNDELAIRPDVIELRRQALELAQREAKMLSAGDFIPTAFKNNIQNCVYAADLARSMGCHVSDVMENLTFIHGNRCWRSTFVINRINRSGRFPDGLRFTYAGEGDARSCFAHAKTVSGEILNGNLVSIKIAKAEGWFQKSGSKWQTIPDQMLCYRAATFFCRQYCPEVLGAVRPMDEIEDMKPAQAKVIRPDFSTTSEAAPAPASRDNSLAGQDITDDSGEPE